MNLALAFEGDSQMAGFGFSANNRAILPWQIALSFTDNRMIGFTNFAVNSTVIAGQAPDMTARAAAIAQWYDERKGNCCLFVFAATNDLYFGANADTVWTRLIGYCGIVKAASPRLPIAVATPLSRSNAGTPADYNVQRAVVRSKMRGGHSSFDIVSDFAGSALIGYDGAELDLNNFQNDAVHLAAPGHAEAGRIGGATVRILFPS